MGLSGPLCRVWEKDTSREILSPSSHCTKECGQPREIPASFPHSSSAKPLQEE